MHMQVIFWNRITFLDFLLCFPTEWAQIIIDGITQTAKIVGSRYKLLVSIPGTIINWMVIDLISLYFSVPMC